MKDTSRGSRSLINITIFLTFCYHKIVKLPKYLTTVTPFSKVVALIIFITFPIFGTYLGYRYGKITSSTTSTATPLKTIIDLVSWQKYTNDKYKISIDYPPDTKLIKELDLSSGTRNLQKTWHLLFTNQKDYPEKVENSLYGKGFYYIQIEISDSTNYDFPFRGKIQVTENNFNSLFGSENSEKGFLRSRSTLKTKGTTYPKHGHISYVIYDYNRIIEINIDSDNIDIIPFTVLDKIVSSFQLL